MGVSDFLLNGEVYFAGFDVSFQVSFVNPSDQSTVLSYEWYMDNTLVIDSNAVQFAGKVDCGTHRIGVRLLTAAGWTGIKSRTFTTCKLPEGVILSGPSEVDEGASVAYRVLLEFSDGSFDDLTAEYVFSSGEGGAFAGNIFTADLDNTAHPLVTIYANKVGSPQLSKQITINDIAPKPGILVVDFYDDVNLDIIGFVDNAEVSVSHVAAYTGNNKIPSSSVPADAVVLASDLNNSSAAKWRFEFNIKKLVAEYPSIQNFVFYIKGRSSAAGTISGAFSLKSDAGVMVLNGSPTSYMPSVVGGIDMVPFTGFTGAVVGGANHSYIESDLTTIIRFNYNVPLRQLTYTTGEPPIVINDFDFMAVRYHWLNGAGSDLDILTGYENTATEWDNIYVGYGQPSQTIPPNINPKSNAYLWWGVDNTTTSGYEAVLIGINAFIAAYPAAQNIIEVGLYAAWYGVPLTGDFTVELVTYKGGAMSLQGTNFVNTGGNQVSSNILSLNTVKQSRPVTPLNSYKIGILKYNKLTKTATIDFPNND